MQIKLNSTRIVFELIKITYEKGEFIWFLDFTKKRKMLLNRETRELTVLHLLSQAGDAP